MTQPHDDDASDFLLSSGRSGGRGAKFERIGQIYSGTIVKAPKKVVQTDMATKAPKVSKFNGQPLYQVLVQIQTELREDAEDDGIRTLFVKNKMTTAVGNAMREAGAIRLEVGGHLQIGYSRDIPSDTPGFRPSKDYVAKYTPPAAKAADDFFAQASQPVSSARQNPSPATVGGGTVVFENQHQEVTATPQRITTLDQLRDTSFNAQGGIQEGTPPF